MRVQIDPSGRNRPQLNFSINLLGFSLSPRYCLALTLPVAVHSMLEVPFAYAYFLVPVMFAVGALEGALCPSRA